MSSEVAPSPPAVAAAPAPAPRRPFALGPLVATVVLLQLAAVAGWIAGTRTPYLRDVLTTHLPMKIAQATAWQRGELPLLDPQRGGGQPSLGNPNGVPLYPDNLLYLVAPPRWALTAHLWLHFLLAPWSAAWLARRLGCGAAASWAGGVCYALAGAFLSTLSYYNLVAGAALAPAFVAACLAARDGRRLAAPAAGVLWALLLLGGDPTLAALASLAVLVALALTRRRDAAAPAGGSSPDSARPRPGAGPHLVRLVLAAALGTLLALPQLAELARVLPTSVRGVRGFGEEERTLGSWDPRQALELAVPLAFGRVDRLGPGGFWGHRFHPGGLPFYLTLYPGLLALGLVAAGGRARGLGGGAGWALVGGGLLLALGRFNPLLGPLLALPGAGLLRFPVKAWLLVSLGVAALAAAGWERAVARREPRARRRLVVSLAGLGGALAAAAALLPLLAAPLEVRLLRLLARGVPAEVVAGTAARWALTCAASAALAAALLVALVLSARRPTAGAALLLGLHGAAQLLFLAPATLASDAAAALAPPPATESRAALLPPGTRVVHGSIGRLFGPPSHGRPPEPSARWLARQGAAAAYPFVGVARGWRYELTASPEGLDGFLTRLAADAVRALPDAARVRLLRRWGIEALLLERPLGEQAAGAEQVAGAPGPLAETRLYRLRDVPAPVRRVHGVRWAAAPAAALAALLDDGFDPSREVVLAGGGAPAAPGSGAVEVRSQAAESLAVVTGGDRPGWLVVDVAWQPHWRAEVAGAPAAVVPANLHRLAVAVPAGQREVRLWVDRGPLHRAAAGAAAGALGLLALALAARSRRAAPPR